MPEALANPNNATEATAPAWSSTLGRKLMLTAVIVFLVAAFGVIEHDPIFANAQITKIDEADIRDNYIEQLETGNRLRQVALVAFGMFGVAALSLCREPRWNVQWRVATPLLLLVSWTLLSVFWSEQPGITAKRLVVLGCILLGSAGLARLYRPKELLLGALITILAFILGSLAIDLAMGGRPWEGGDYRFGGTLHPNAQATYCAVLCLAAFTQPIGFGRRWILRLLFVFGVGLIVLTQSRTGLLSLAIALVFVWMLRLPSLYKWAGMGVVVGLAAAAFIAWYSVGEGARSRTVNAALLGRTEQSKSLTGRVPLWEELTDYASRRPVCGYGYEGFWTDSRIAAIMKSQNWTLQNAHNSYLEIVLQLGYVGLFFAIWFAWRGGGALVEAYNLTREPGYAFAFGVLVLGLSNSLLESLFVKLRYTPVIALMGLLAVTLFFPFADSDNADADDPRLKNRSAWLPSLNRLAARGATPPHAATPR